MRRTPPYNGHMARGFESKSVEAQQEEAARGPRPPGRPLTPEERAIDDHRRGLELTRKRTQHDLGRASAPAHRRMLEEAIASLGRQIDDLVTRA